jgi:hypothetical protein
MWLQRDGWTVAKRLLDDTYALWRIHLVLRTFGIVRILDMGEVLVTEFAEQEAVGSELLELFLLGHG